MELPKWCAFFWACALLQVPHRTLALALSSGDGLVGTCSASDGSDVCVPRKAIFVGGAVVVVLILLCISGWGFTAYLLYRLSRQPSARSRSVRFADFLSVTAPTGHSSLSTIQCHALSPTTPNDREISHRNPLQFHLPTSKSDLSAILASGKQAVKRVSRSDTELAANRLQRKAPSGSGKEQAGDISCRAVCETLAGEPQATRSDPHLLSTASTAPAQSPVSEHTRHLSL